MFLDKKYNHYIKPVLANIDEQTRKYFLYNFWVDYGWNPRTMLRLKSEHSQDVRIQSFYWALLQLYYAEYSNINVVYHGRAAQDTVRDTIRELSDLRKPLAENDEMLSKLLPLMSRCHLTTSVDVPKIPNDVLRSKWKKIVR